MIQIKQESGKTIHEYKFDTDRTFGVEFEIMILRNANSESAEGWSRDPMGLWEYLRREGFTVARPAGYHMTGRFNGWKMERDGSLQIRHADEVQGIEIISPILKGWDGISQIMAMTAALDEFGCSVNRSCGMHVHHDVTDFNDRAFQNLYEFYMEGQEAINYLLPKSRRQSSYCRPLPKVKYDRVKRGAPRHYSAGQALSISPNTSGHYTALNFQGYVQRGTVEFRQHSGTVEGQKAVAWIMFTQSIVLAASRYEWKKEKDSLSLKELFHKIGWTTSSRDDHTYRPGEEFVEARKYLRARYNHFRKQEGVVA